MLIQDRNYNTVTRVSRTKQSSDCAVNGGWNKRRVCEAIPLLIGCIELIFSCPHVVINSDLLLRSVDLSADIMQSFSIRQKLQRDRFPL